MRKVFTYSIIWNGQRHTYRYYTNITYSIFLISVLKYLGIPEQDKNNCELFLDNQLIPSTFIFPFNGVTGPIRVEKKTSIIH